MSTGAKRRKKKSAGLSGEEAKRRALSKMAELKQISDELSAIVAEIPLPTPEEFEEMRDNKRPWTLEAYMAAVINRADLYVDEARVTLNDYGAETTAEDLAERCKWQHPPPFLERSLRFLIEERSGKKIEPSPQEESYHNPYAGAEALIFGLVGRAVRALLRQV